MDVEAGSPLPLYNENINLRRSLDGRSTSPANSTVTSLNVSGVSRSALSGGGKVRRVVAREKASKLVVFLGVAVIVEAIGAAAGSLTEEGCRTMNTCGSSQLRGLGCLIIIFASLFLIMTLVTKSPTIHNYSFLSSSASILLFGAFIRLTSESALLSNVWSLPVLPRLTAAYCNPSTIQNQRHKLKTLAATNPVMCSWQRDEFAYFRAKEIGALLTNTVFLLMFLTSVGVVCNRMLSYSIRDRVSFKVLVCGLCLGVFQSAITEGILLPMHTLGYMDDNTLQGKLVTTALGSTLEAVSSGSMLALFLCTAHPSASSTKLACILLCIGTVLRLIGECQQLDPHSTWITLGMTAPLVFEAALRIVSSLLFCLSTISFVTVVVLQRTKLADDEFGVA